MSKYFMYGTSLGGIEQLMMLAPNFHQRRSGIVINNYFNCKGGFRDCNCIVSNVKNRCNAARCFCSRERLDTDEIIAKSKELASKNDLIGAINILEDSKNYIKDKKSIEELLKEYKEDASREIIRMAVEKAEVGDLDEALDILKTSSKYSSNSNIQEKINEIKQKKKEQNKDIVLDIKKRITINYDDVEKEYKIAPKGYSTRYENISRAINVEPRMIFENSPTSKALEVSENCSGQEENPQAY